MDLSPRAVALDERPPGSPLRRDRRKWVSIGLLVAVIAIGAVVVTKFLTNSLDYYCNVDEIDVKSGCETGRRLRIQGTVVEGSVQSADGTTTFALSFNGATVDVLYDSGQPGGLFQECIPVVVHGVMGDDGVFAGDDVEVKHTNEYVAENADRIDEAESAACSQQ